MPHSDEVVQTCNPSIQEAETGEWVVSSVSAWATWWVWVQARLQSETLVSSKQKPNWNIVKISHQTNKQNETKQNTQYQNQNTSVISSAHVKPSGVWTLLGQVFTTRSRQFAPWVLRSLHSRATPTQPSVGATERNHCLWNRKQDEPWNFRKYDL